MSEVSRNANAYTIQEENSTTSLHSYTGTLHLEDVLRSVTDAAARSRRWRRVVARN